MGITAAKQCCEQFICKNKVTPFRTQTVEPVSNERDGMTNIDDNNPLPNLSHMLDTAGDSIPMPMKKMAWEMIPPNSKLKSVLEFCKKSPTNSPKQETVSKDVEMVNPIEVATSAPPLASGPSPSPPPPPMVVEPISTSTMAGDTIKELEGVPQNITTAASETLSETSEMITETVETLNLDNIAQPTVNTQVKPWLLHPDSVADLATDK